MRATRWGLLTALVALGAGQALAATVSVTITGLSNTGYELEISGIRKTGRLGAVPGPSTVRDVVDVGQRQQVTANLTFMDGDGVIASCPGVQVKVDGARAACEPMFVLTGSQSGSDRFTCKTTCARTQRARDEDDDDDDDWVYACAGPMPSPRLDGWSLGMGETPKFQSLYRGSMSEGASASVYSAASTGNL